MFHYKSIQIRIMRHFRISHYYQESGVSNNGYLDAPGAAAPPLRRPAQDIRGIDQTIDEYIPRLSSGSAAWASFGGGGTIL
jgi:hypothetical protein